MTTAKSHNAQFTGHAESFVDDASSYPRHSANISDSLVLEIARACKALEESMWERLKRHADVADLKVVIKRAIEEHSR